MVSLRVIRKAVRLFHNLSVRSSAFLIGNTVGIFGKADTMTMLCGISRILMKFGNTSKTIPEIGQCKNKASNDVLFFRLVLIDIGFVSMVQSEYNEERSERNVQRHFLF